MRRMLSAWLFVFLSLLPAAVHAQPADGIERLVGRLEQAVRANDRLGIRAQAAFSANADQIDQFVGWLTAVPVSNATVKERDRLPLASGRQRLMVEIFIDSVAEGRVSTWRLDVERTPDETDTWQIAAFERLSVVGGLYRLSLNAQTEFDVHNLTLRAPDLTIALPSGRAFTADTPDGATAVVLLGKGRLTFSPALPAERGQVRIFCGREALDAEFSAVFLRINPFLFASQVPAGALVPRAVSPKDLRRATDVFETYVGKSFQIDLMDLSIDRWSIVPSGEDFVAEIVTKKYGALTYARANGEPEDVTLFDRERRRNISVYASAAKLASRGRFYSEDDQTDYDVTSYKIAAAFDPERTWIDGNVQLTLRTRHDVSTMTLKLAAPLVVRGVSSPQFGRLLHLRVVGQNSMLISFPATVPAEEELQLTIVYGGRLPPQEIEREAVSVQDPQAYDVSLVPLEPRFIYSNRSLWYPQATVTDYATAVLTLTIPVEYDVVASGVVQGPATAAPAATGTDRPRKQVVFVADSPARYLACIISRFGEGRTAYLDLPTLGLKTGPTKGQAALGDGGGPEPGHSFTLQVRANPRQSGRAGDYTQRAADIFTFYTSLIGEAPYPAFTLAVTDSNLPGGHSPAYFAILNQALPSSPFVWRNDPVAFTDYSSFFLAHEIAHQWWGQAVGWKNYHEQWISEGFAQYFAVLYAERERGPDDFAAIMRQMCKWARDTSDEGPVYLGYRLGHIEHQPRVFRALVYNKGAVVLHMLRRLIGERAFFAGLREFYASWRFRKAGTNDFRLVMEAASGRSLSKFFDGWIYGSAVPRVKFSYTVDETTHEVTLRFEQPEPAMEFPLTVQLKYDDGPPDTIVVDVAEPVTERRLPLKGRLDKIEVNRDELTVAEIDR